MTIILLAAVIVLGAVCFFLLRMKPRSATNISIIQAALECCGEMTTMKAYFETIADKKKENDTIFGIPVPMTWQKFAVILSGTVDAGFDMTKARIEVNEEAKIMEVILPHCEIQRVWLDLESKEKKLKVYDQDNGFFTKALTLEEQNEVITAALAEMRRHAKEEWKILPAAEEKAASIYKNFLSPLGYRVSVRFTDDASSSSDVKGERLRSGGIVIFRAA